ncbi:MAG: hypothetical protein AB8B83_06060 [Bdellovibrionales bacterium]
MERHMPIGFNSRYHQAFDTPVPGNKLFWDTVLEESDNFATKTALAGKGGPFGAQLWAINKRTNEVVLFGKGKNKQASNAVLSKGLASAHAEAESLSEENRDMVKKFLGKYQNDDMDWEIVQTSSGESCPSCRSKQVLFARELQEKGLVAQKGFHVIFKAIYEQTKQVAKFDDKPFDIAFRAARGLALAGSQGGLLKLNEKLLADPALKKLIDDKELIYLPVSEVESKSLSAELKRQFDRAKDSPFAALVAENGEILASAQDTRAYIGQFEKGAMIAALQQAAGKNKDRGVKNPWLLNGAKLVTNIRDIGPGAYSESLWYGLSGIEVVSDHASPDIDLKAREVKGQTNFETFAQVAADYDADDAVLNVRYNPYEDTELEENQQYDANTSTAHIVWYGIIHRHEKSMNTQADRLQKLKEQGITDITHYNGTSRRKLPLHKFVQYSNDNSDYDPSAAAPQVA